MFEASRSPRLFALPPGVDFPRAVVDGLRVRSAGAPPEALARTALFVNTRRMQRRLSGLFDEGPALLLPQLRLVTDLGQDAAFADLPPAVSPLRRRLEIAEIVGRLLDAQPDLAPRAVLYDLADSLAALMDEMQGEGVSPDAIRALDVSDISGHWQRSLTFLKAVETFFGETSDAPPDAESRQRRVIDRLVSLWQTKPPSDPIIIAGSTGSRGATQTLMRAVANLPQGAVILPGFDFDMPAKVWAELFRAAESSVLGAEDHPQFRFVTLMQSLGISPDQVLPWSDHQPPNPRRNAFVSLALRPAPITDQWREEGPVFGEIETVCEKMTLIEAASPRDEAVAIALILREAAEQGTEAALITPDRRLTRQVTAALDRWRIEPDDSAGRPLPLSPPGRLLRHVAELTGAKITGAELLALLKHPLTNTGSEARGEHLRLTRDLELEALRDGMPYPSPTTLSRWASNQDDRRAWVAWLTQVLDKLNDTGTRSLTDHVAHTLATAELIASGPSGAKSNELWAKPAGREARHITDELLREAPHGGTLAPADYRDLFISVLNRSEVRDPIQPHPGIRIWGTLEARVQGVELVILAGLNEGSWPEAAPPDPWMNRKMRAEAGLLLPERRIGLAAHDFQQAVGAERVVLTRAIRDEESQTVPSRLINRFTNLLHGMSETGAKELEIMRARGTEWLRRAQLLDAAGRTAAAPRPSPQPPVATRPSQLSVTRIKTLVRDPYAIYAERVLGLRPLGRLSQTADAPLRGTILHRVLERFIEETPKEEPTDTARARLMGIAAEVLAAEAPWPATRVLWLAKFGRIADSFLSDEAARRSRATPLALEVPGRMSFDALGFTLTGTADRIDQDEAGALYIYDYKTGRIPSEAEREHIDKQLYLEAVMARAGAFRDLAPGKVAEVAYIGLGAEPKFERIEVGDDVISATRDELVELIAKYRNRAQGYTARRLAEKTRFEGDYDHLARYGEWDHATPATPLEVGE